MLVEKRCCAADEANLRDHYAKWQTAKRLVQVGDVGIAAAAAAAAAATTRHVYLLRTSVVVAVNGE